MEFYKVVLNNGIYEMQEVEDNECGEDLSQEQMGILMQKLGAMYNKGENILNMRKYCLAYYSNAVKEYVNLSACPSSMINEKRLFNKFGKKVLLDAFSITLLEGEEENRININEDGVFECRGFSILQVMQMLEEMTSALNETEILEDVLLEKDVEIGNIEKLLENSKNYFLAVANDFSADALDFAQSVIDYYKVTLATGEEKYVGFNEEIASEWEKIEFTLVHKDGKYVVSVDKANKLVVKQEYYKFEQKNAIAQGVLNYIKSVVDNNEKNS